MPVPNHFCDDWDSPTIDLYNAAENHALVTACNDLIVLIRIERYSCKGADVDRMKNAKGCACLYPDVS